MRPYAPRLEQCQYHGGLIWDSAFVIQPRIVRRSVIGAIGMNLAEQNRLPAPQEMPIRL